MIFTLTCFMFLLTGSCVSPDVYDDPLMSSQSFNNISVTLENATNYVFTDFSNLTSNQTSDKKASTCSYKDVLNHLHLNKDNETFTVSRPVKDHTHKTFLYLEMMVYAILDVKETDQTFVAYVWIYMDWENDYTKWNKDDFCGISDIIVPTGLLWKPDMTIEEMIEKDKAPPSPFLKIHSNGLVEFSNDQIVISTCKMHVHKFPFDIQTCNITFKSYLYGEHELQVNVLGNRSVISKWAQKMMSKDFEWLLVDMSVTSYSVNHYGYDQTVVVYTIEIRRKSALHFVSFVLPILFFLCLDFFSLLLPHGGGEKIGFKTTVLLAVTVMQLIVIEILPVTSSKIPLLVVFILGIFGLMLLSLLETIVVINLLEKDSASKDDAQSLNEEHEMKKCFHCSSTFDETADQYPSIDKEGSRDRLTEVFLAVEKVSDQLQGVKRSVAFLSNKMEQKPRYWARIAKTIDKIFTYFYVTAVIVFLCVIFNMWLS
ncbi:5-hydroxytryptamine receptor 3A-like [Poeciliopsis prolifica]|uniref:5-hydroxytryptamine receptor 3A-like n=1 Tax=Poeciliopsis prolifica TaxID=188132 RepID=UPI0024139464|nr:5-hydroxytryptamine receptor 3A-like [Poeciliopsis prolifica]